MKTPWLRELVQEVKYGKFREEAKKNMDVYDLLMDRARAEKQAMQLDTARYLVEQKQFTVKEAAEAVKLSVETVEAALKPAG